MKEDSMKKQLSYMKKWDLKRKMKQKLIILWKKELRKSYDKF
jgi:hypothetical protein